VADLKHQTNMNSAMKQCNDMLEIKIQQLEGEKTKLLVENKCINDKIKTLRCNQIEQKLFKRALGCLLRTQLRRKSEANKWIAFSRWKGKFVII
jgi:hypothetical protein